MIPADIASNVKLLTQDLPAPVQPAQPARQINDALSQLSAGQRIMAEIQSLLPNGMYRAVVAQRELTLALPFSAKPGDTLELEVVESDGKLTLAFVANRGENTAGKQEASSAATSLSNTGRLIGDLLQEIGSNGRRAPPAVLNTNAPITQQMPQQASDLVPLLKQALSQSGVFYEAHQARWVAGQLPTEQLRQEPQGQQPVTPSLLALAAKPPVLPDSAAPPAPGQASDPALQTTTKVASSTGDASPMTPSTAKTSPDPSAEGLSKIAPQATAADKPSPLTGIPRDLTPIVQQQLDGLANQNFAWQGQIWPGQTLWWEIGEQGSHGPTDQEDPGRQWRTRLKLSLPRLGGIDAQLQLLAGGRVSIQIQTSENTAEQRLNDQMNTLRDQFAAAGLDLAALHIQQHAPSET
ncbi:MAG: flagellar hook-length control protein FliK [Dechloromonas sp.]|nr:flagellar hook-length control protein FliK [Dechloromonas sp.]